MKHCAICPHQSDCLKVGACLDDLNAPWIAVRNFPQLMTPAQASVCMASLREGKTLRRITNGGKLGPAIVSLKKLKKHCALYPEWGAEAVRLAKANAKAADALKSPKLYLRLCKYGHALDRGRIYFRYGYECRRCQACDKLRNARAGVIRPEALAKATIALRNGVTIAQILRGTPMGGGRRDRSLVVINSAAFYRYRHENSEFNRFVRDAIEKRIGRSSNPVLAVAAGTFKYEWDPADYQRIRALLPEHFPDKDVVINDIIVSLLEGRLDRSQIGDKIRWYKPQANRAPRNQKVGRREREYRHSAVMGTWRALTDAEDDFRDAQMAVAKIDARDMGELALKACLSGVYDAQHLSYQNAAVIGFSVALKLTPESNFRF